MTQEKKCNINDSLNMKELIELDIDLGFSMEYEEFDLDSNIIKDMANVIVDLVNYYKESDKRTVALNFGLKLMNIQSDFYNKYYEYFWNNHIDRWFIYKMISSEVDGYIESEN